MVICHDFFKKESSLCGTGLDVLNRPWLRVVIPSLLQVWAPVPAGVRCPHPHFPVQGQPVAAGLCIIEITGPLGRHLLLIWSLFRDQHHLCRDTAYTCKTRVWGGLGQLPLFVFHAIPPVPLAREAFFPPKSKCSCQSNLGGLSWPPRTATWTSLWSSSSQRPVCYSGSGTVTQRTSCSDTSNVAQPFTLLIPFLCLLLHIYWVDFDTPVMYYLYFLLLMIRIC